MTESKISDLAFQLRFQNPVLICNKFTQLEFEGILKNALKKIGEEIKEDTGY